MSIISGEMTDMKVTERVQEGTRRVAALEVKNLKEVRLELAFIPSPFREETLNFAVSIGGQSWRSTRPTPFNV